ncbi:MAG: hypothetical protein ACE5PV_21955 [Candidatus Poribacteria bacterium]
MLSALGEKIFADRYAKKEYNNFVYADKVLVRSRGQSLLGTVISKKDDKVEVKLENGKDIHCEKSNIAKPRGLVH